MILLLMCEVMIMNIININNIISNINVCINIINEMIILIIIYY